MPDVKTLREEWGKGKDVAVFAKALAEIERLEGALKLRNSLSKNYSDRVDVVEQRNAELEAKVYWLNEIYAGLLVSHKHLAPKYPGDDEVLKLYRQALAPAKEEDTHICEDPHCPRNINRVKEDSENG